MRANIKINGKVVGNLEKTDEQGYTFSYVKGYNGPPISRSFKKLGTTYQRADGNLFPFFSGLLSEGAQKDIQCSLLKINPKDDFTRLIKTASHTIGAVTVEQSTL